MRIVRVAISNDNCNYCASMVAKPWFEWRMRHAIRQWVVLSDTAQNAHKTSCNRHLYENYHILRWREPNAVRNNQPKRVAMCVLYFAPAINTLRWNVIMRIWQPRLRVAALKRESKLCTSFLLWLMRMSFTLRMHNFYGNIYWPICRSSARLSPAAVAHSLQMGYVCNLLRKATLLLLSLSIDKITAAAAAAARRRRRWQHDTHECNKSMRRLCGKYVLCHLQWRY